MGRLFFILFIVSSLLACNRTVSDDTHLSTNTSREEIEDSLSQRIIELTDSIHCLNDSINKCLKQVKLSTPNVEVNLLLDSIDKAHKTELNIYIDSMSLNGKTYTKNYLEHSDLISGAVLDIEMNDIPNYRRGVDKNDFPYSFSQGK